MSEPKLQDCVWCGKLVERAEPHELVGRSLLHLHCVDVWARERVKHPLWLVKLVEAFR